MKKKNCFTTESCGDRVYRNKTKIMKKNQEIRLKFNLSLKLMTEIMIMVI